MKSTTLKSRQLRLDLTYTNELCNKISEIDCKTSELRMRSHQILSRNYMNDQKRKKLLTYIIQNEKSF